MTNVYKIKLFRWDFKESDDYVAYCIKNNYLGWGWKNKNNAELKQNVKQLDEYYHGDDEINKGYFGGSPKKLKESLKAASTMKTGDFCWAYGKRKEDRDKSWYLGLINQDDFLCGNCDPNWREIGMLRACEWHKIPFDFVPGNITAFTHDRFTLRLIMTDSKDKTDANPSYVTYCRLLYEYYKHLEDIPTHLNLNLWQLAHPDDLEDLVGLYLQTIGYYIFPSTNKQGTKDYEYKLIYKCVNPEKNEHREAIIQCKNQKTIDINALIEKYPNMDIFILSIKENEQYKKQYEKENWNDIGWKKDNTFIFNSERLESWAQENKGIMPKRIRKFLELSE